MITMDEGTLPRKVTPQNAPQLAGETAYWFCTTCKRWRTSTIQEDGAITCSACGNRPDDKHTPLLAYRSRYEIVNKLCAPESEWRKRHDDLIECYEDFIDATWRGLPARAKQSVYRYFGTAWREIDGIGDYLLTALDAPGANHPHSYTEKGLRRRYFRPKRKYNTATLSDIRLNREDGDDMQYTDEETAEMMSYKAGLSAPFWDQKPILDELLCGIPDGLEREIARDFAQGATKRDVERAYGLSEGKVRTIVRHIAKQLKQM